jgi:hypothetical protein
MLEVKAMEHVNPEFDVLVERAEACGAKWAARTLKKTRTEAVVAPAKWQGTLDEARGMVDSFARRVGFMDRERLAIVVQHAARSEWVEALATQRFFRAEAESATVPRTRQRTSA